MILFADITEAVLKGADYAAGKNDRWLMIFLLFFALTIMLYAVRWQTNKGEKRDEMFASLQKETAEHAINFALCIDRNTKAFERNTDMFEKNARTHERVEESLKKL